MKLKITIPQINNLELIDEILNHPDLSRQVSNFEKKGRSQVPASRGALPLELLNDPSVLSAVISGGITILSTLILLIADLLKSRAKDTDPPMVIVIESGDRELTEISGNQSKQEIRQCLEKAGIETSDNGRLTISLK